MGWEAFEDGQTVQGIELLYFGLRNATDELVPPELKNDTTYNLIMDTLDGVITDLSQNVMDYKNQMTQGNVCWKATQSRDKVRPRICPTNYTWGGEQFCFKTGPGELLQTGASKQLEAALKRKSGNVDGGVSGKVPKGAIPARCDEGGPYPEKRNGWCFAPCPTGFESHDMRCRTVCQGMFHEDDDALMCGKSRGALVQAVQRMVIETVNAGLTIHLVIQKMVDDGVDAQSLSGTIQAFINLGKPFAYST